jgi:hypothetical protein
MGGEGACGLGGSVKDDAAKKNIAKLAVLYSGQASDSNSDHDFGTMFA